MRTLRGIAAAFAFVICATTALGTASAQSEPPFDGAIDVQLFEYAIGPKSFLTVNSAENAARAQYSVDFLLTFLTNPFTVFNVDADMDEIDGTRTQVIQNMLAGELSGAYGLTDKLQLGVALPMILSMSGEGINPIDAMSDPDGLQVTGLGDLRAEVKATLWKRARMRLAGIGGLTLPSSFGAGGNQFIGDDLPSARARAAFQWTNPGGNFTAGANLGVILRKPREIYANTVGQQITYGGAGAFQFNERFSGVAEVFGRTGVPGFAFESSPIEINGAVRVQATQAIHVLAGGGAGVVGGIGSPGLRVFVSVGWAPDYRDSDGDGISNIRDKCPLLAEDADGFEDSDGCPDDDNDGDRREDAADKCPNEPEDIDGFEDEDGCPEADNDNDGIDDVKDRCPNEAEDKIGLFKDDGCPASKSDADDDNVMDDVDKCPEEPEDVDEFEDWDGCPDPDNDNDGVPDESDKCPLCPEDIDQFQDEDGCPDTDNDRDGISDARDQCPLEAETLNGRDDDDGCPDRGGAQLAELQGDLLVLREKIEFRRNRLRPRSQEAIDQAAVIIKRHPEVTQWLIVVAARRQRTDEATRELSQKQANVIKAQLLIRGVPSDRVQAVGAVSDNPRVGIAVRERAAASADELNACPASLQVQPREPEPEPAETPTDAAAAPAAAPAATPVAAPAVVPDEFGPYTGVVSSIAFQRDKDVMQRSANKTLDKIAELMLANPRVHIEIGAHTDSRKGPERTKQITQAQADKVVAYLIEKGVPAERVVGVGHGMDQPIGDNNRSRGRAKNRRIELTFTIK